VTSFDNTGGLCGMWNGDKDQSKQLFILNQNGDFKYLPDLDEKTSISQALQFWRLHSDRYLQTIKTSKRCTECVLASEKRLYCPGDDFNLADHINRNNTLSAHSDSSYCQIKTSKYIESIMNYKESDADEDCPKGPAFIVNNNSFLFINGQIGESCSFRNEF
jgi:hypothetical protein